MNLRRFFLEAGAIAAIAVIIALVSNALAPRDKKLNLVGDYPNAGIVPTRSLAPVPNRVGAPVDADGDGPSAAQVREVPTTSDAAASRKADQTPPNPVTESASAAAAPAAKPVSTTVPSSQSPAHRASRAEILHRFPPSPDTQYKEISGDDAAWLHANGVLFLDARRTSVYEDGHIAGARSFPVWESDITNRIGELLNEVTDQDMPIVVYCSGGECEDSHMLAQKLWGVFYSNVLVYKDGFPDWQKRGGPIRTGDTP